MEADHLYLSRNLDGHGQVERVEGGTVTMGLDGPIGGGDEPIGTLVKGFKMTAVEAYDYTPYGTPTVHSLEI